MSNVMQVLFWFFFLFNSFMHCLINEILNQQPNPQNTCSFHSLVWELSADIKGVTFLVLVVNNFNDSWGIRSIFAYQNILWKFMICYMCIPHKIYGFFICFFFLPFVPSHTQSPITPWKNSFLFFIWFASKIP